MLALEAFQNVPPNFPARNSASVGCTLSRRDRGSKQHCSKQASSLQQKINLAVRWSGVRTAELP